MTCFQSAHGSSVRLCWWSIVQGDGGGGGGGEMCCYFTQDRVARFFLKDVFYISQCQSVYMFCAQKSTAFLSFHTSL